MDKQTLLIADDETFIRQAYRDGFERAGYTVLTAENGSDAMDVLRGGQHVDLVLLDLVMPKMNGFEVLRAIREDPSLGSTKVLVLSNLSQPSDEDEALSLGALGFIVKSNYSLQALRALVGDALRG